MSTCPNCGAESAGDSAFCTSCGAPLKPTAAPPAATSVATDPMPSAPPPYGAQNERPPDRPTHVQHSTGSSGFADFVTFRTMVTPILVQIAFWLFEIMNLIGHIVGMYGLSDADAPGWAYLAALLSLALTALLIRVFLETLIVVFSINSNVVRIRRHLEK